MLALALCLVLAASAGVWPSYGTPCIVALPSVLRVESSHAVSVQLAASWQGIRRSANTSSEGRRGHVTLAFETGTRASSATSSCLPERTSTCLWFAAESVHPDRVNKLTVKIPVASVPDCTPGLSLPISARVECLLGTNLQTQWRHMTLECHRAKVLLQLDKAIYSPGQKVFIRGFFVDDKLRSVNQKVIVEVRNPHGVLLGLRSVEGPDELEDGVIEYEYLLGDEPQFGFWSITIRPVVEPGLATILEPAYTTFEVKEYILPRFSVEVSLPKVLTNLSMSPSANVPVEVVARYAYNAAVHGSASIQATLVWSGIRRPVHVLHADKPLVANESPGNIAFSSASFSVLHSEVQRSLVFDALPFGSCLEVTASIRDITSLRVVKGISQVCFEEHECYINASYLDSIVKPGLGYSSQVRLEDNAGGPVADQQAKVIIYQRRADFSTVTSQLETTSDQSGFIHFQLRDNILRDAAVVTVEITTKCSPPFGRVLVVCREPPPCPGQLRLDVLLEGKAKVKANLHVRIHLSRPAAEETKVVLLAVRGGNVLESFSGKILQNASWVADKTINVRPEWSPGFYFLVYHVCRNGEIVSDSVFQPVEYFEENSAGYSFHNYIEQSPLIRIGQGSQVQGLKIHAAPGSTVYMLTVDQSVHFMNSTHRLTREKLLREYDSQDWFAKCKHRPSCSSDYAFQRAGLAGFGARTWDADQTNPWCKARPRPIAMEDCCYRGRVTGRRYGSSPIFRVQRCRNAAHSLHQSHGHPCSGVFLHCCLNFRTTGVHQPGRGLSLAGSGPAEIDQVYERRYFPETIVNKYVLSQSTLFTKFHMPDSITGWTMQGIVVHPDYPLAVPEELNFRTFKPFFLVLHLPSSLVHVEQFAMRVTLYASASDVGKVFSLYLDGSDQYCSVAGTGDRSANTTVTIPASGSVTLTYIITPLVTGTIEIGVSAIYDTEYFSSLESDRVTRTVQVKPRGVTISEQCDTFPMVLRGGGQVTEHEFNFTLPQNYRYGTVRPSIKLSGNILSDLSRLDGVEKLLRMPTGCGEQNMLRFSVNTFVLRYLAKTCQQQRESLPRLIRRKALDVMREGYRRQLNYQRQDGSFSAFGQADKHGSTWLTAFVIKCFCAVDPDMTNQIPIDSSVVQRALRWLGTRQTFEGGFLESGTVIDGCIKGGGSGHRQQNEIDHQLVAYVTTALLECNRTGHYPLAGGIAERPLQFLAQTFPDLTRTYDVALTSYALALAGPAYIDPGEVEKKLQTFSSVIDGAMCDRAHQRDPRLYRRSCTSVYLETSAYAMLAQMQLGTASQCGQCYVDWLMRWRTEEGGFVSTQDTVLAVQAMSEYMCCHVGETLRQNLTVDVASRVLPSGRQEVHHYQLTEENKDLEKRIPLSGSFRKSLSVRITASGEGRVSVQRCLKYNAERDETACNFTIAVAMDESPQCANREASDSANNLCQIMLRVSVGLHPLAEINRTGMAIIEVQLLSGFTVEPDTLKRLKGINGIRRTERSGQSLLFYLDYIERQVLTVSVQLQRTDLIGRVQPAVVKVYDYYNPGISCHKFYHLKSKSPMLSVLCGQRDCLCGAGDCLPCPENGKYVLGKRSYQMAALVCRNDYGWKVRIHRVKILENGWAKIRGEVQDVIKQGERDVTKGETLTFYRPSHCPCPDLDEGSSYLITGQDRGVKLVLDKGTRIEKWNRTQRFCHFRRLLATRPGICDAVDSIRTEWQAFKSSIVYKACVDTRPA